MANCQLHIDDVSKDGVTGHITMHAHIVEIVEGGDELHGPIETHGIDPIALTLRYGPVADPEGEWLAEVKAKMLGNHTRRSATHAKLITLKGTRV